MLDNKNLIKGKHILYDVNGRIILIIVLESKADRFYTRINDKLYYGIPEEKASFSPMQWPDEIVKCKTFIKIVHPLFAGDLTNKRGALLSPYFSNLTYAKIGNEQIIILKEYIEIMALSTGLPLNCRKVLAFMLKAERCPDWKQFFMQKNYILSCF